MRGRRSIHTAELAEEILARLSGGRSLRAVCRDHGMPDLNTVLNWVNEDREGFAARYRQALETGNAPRGRPSLYSTQIAEWILEELSEGRRLSDICDEPGMPSANAVRLWAMQDRDGFAARYRQARETGGVGMGRRALYTPELAEIILDELGSGRTLAEVCRDPDMPSEGTVRLWVIHNRNGFAARYTTFRELGDDAMAGQMLMIADSRRDDWIPRVLPNGEIEMILDPDRVRRAELRVNTRYLLLSKGLQRKYGARR